MDSHFPTIGLDNIMALLEHSDRVCQVSFMRVRPKFAYFRKSFGSDAGAIPGTDRFGALVSSP